MNREPHPPDPEPNPEHRRGLDETVAVLIRELDFRPAQSVLDIGCNTGNWLRAFLDVFPHEIDATGMDVEAMRPRLVVNRGHFRSCDLTGPLHENIVLTYDGLFDLVLCLEVGEHLPAEHAKKLVQLCTIHAPVVLFSAAVPGQGGHGHVNEQPHAYWRDLFAAEGYSWDESIRAKLPESLAAYYRNNMAVCRRLPG